MNGERRSSLYLLTGLIVGLILGLVYSLVLDPVRLMNTAPHSLGVKSKEQYRVLIALVYQANGDLGRAANRLSLLQDDDEINILAEQAQELIEAGGSSQHASALLALSEALEDYLKPTDLSQEAAGNLGTTLPPEETAFIPTSTMDPDEAIRSPTPGPSQSPTPVVTFTPRSTPIPNSVLEAAFTLEEMTEVCIPDSAEILLQVEVLDKDEQPLPGIMIQVTWDEGEDFFYTGLYPQHSPGYADFSMQPDVIYALKAGEQGQTVGNISATECETSEGGTYSGGWLLTFVEP